jgi:hypothetical protein
MSIEEIIKTPNVIPRRGLTNYPFIYEITLFKRGVGGE